MTTVEELSKTQIILLTLLVSFITSIGTGIIASSLLYSTPGGVTQVVDRVIQQTINAPANPIDTGTTQVTVINPDDAITSAIDTASQSLVRIKKPGDDFYGLGVIVSRDGQVLTQSVELSASSAYTIILPDGSSVLATVLGQSIPDRLVLFKITPDSKHASFTPLNLAKSDAKLGQTVIALEGQTKNSVAVGRITSIGSSGNTVQTDLASAGEIIGSPLINAAGELVGLKISNEDYTFVPGVYTTLAPLKALIKSL